MSQNSVTEEQVLAILAQSEFVTYDAVFGKQCIVVALLPNGFTVVGESACVDPSNYDSEIGYELAMNRIKSKIWELEGYKLQSELSK